MHNGVAPTIENMGQDEALTTDLKQLVALSRFFVVLPEPLPMPDEYQVMQFVGNTASDLAAADDDPWVWLRFRQVQGASRAVGALEALQLVAPKQEHPAKEERSPAGLGLDADYTVVEAVTPDVSPDDSRQYSGTAGELPPRADPLNRCLRLIDDCVRAYRLAAEAPYGRLRYECLTLSALAYRGFAPLVKDAGLDGISVNLDQAIWGQEHLILLDHLNTPDPPLGPTLHGALEERFARYMADIRSDSPFVGWLEHLAEARIALHLRGEYGAAVVLAHTASEVLVDALLSVMLWEEGADPTTAALSFRDDRAVKRIMANFPSRLGGSWNLSGDGPVARWYRGSAQLRNRIVHAGYSPSRVEVLTAMDAVHGLADHCFNRLVVNRNAYMRATLMSVAKEGLEKRGLWSGKIKAFFHGPAQEEPDWKPALGKWRSQMITERLGLVDDG